MRPQRILICLTLTFSLTSLLSFADEPIHVLVANDDGIDSLGLEAIATVIAASKRSQGSGARQGSGLYRLVGGRHAGHSRPHRSHRAVS
jgi:hypothetical protein